MNFISYSHLWNLSEILFFFFLETFDDEYIVHEPGPQNRADRYHLVQPDEIMLEYYFITSSLHNWLLEVNNW